LTTWVWMPYEMKHLLSYLAVKSIYRIQSGKFRLSAANYKTCQDWSHWYQKNIREGWGMLFVWMVRRIGCL
jgi:hypothetical protein